MKTQRGMSRADLLALPVSFDLETAGRACGIGRTLAYDMAKRGEFPVRVLRLGKAYRVTRADLLRYLGEADDVMAAA
ncbi:helix-turn-helix domain-containing protein [Plantactinospora sp. CA-290183]|uniref:helix-turn-helix domain-containing protein n=1 Tax=Plantactinospora sp. CA-290183 TaxID=3240006 RepID=UPI003D8CA4F5